MDPSLVYYRENNFFPLWNQISKDKSPSTLYYGYLSTCIKDTCIKVHVYLQINPWVTTSLSALFIVGNE